MFLKALKILTKIVELACIIKALPFSIHYENYPKICSVTKSLFHTAFCFIWILISLFMEIYLVFQLKETLNLCSRNKSTGSCDYNQINWLSMWFVGYTWGLCCRLNFYLFRKEIAAYFNEICILKQNIQNADSSDRKRVSTKGRFEIDFTIIALLQVRYVSIGMHFLMGGMRLMNPNYKHFLASTVFGGSFSLEFWILFVLDSMFLLDNISVLSSAVALLSWYILFTSNALKQLRKPNLSLRTQLELYRQLELLSLVHSESNALSIPVLVTSFMVFIVIECIGLIRLHDVANTVDLAILSLGAMSCFFILTGVLHFFGSIPDNCNKLLKVLKKRSFNDRKQFWTKRLKSLRAFGIQNGPVRIMRYNAIYLAFATISNLLVTILTVMK